MYFFFIILLEINRSGSTPTPVITRRTSSPIILSHSLPLNRHPILLRRRPPSTSAVELEDNTTHMLIHTLEWFHRLSRRTSKPEATKETVGSMQRNHLLVFMLYLFTAIAERPLLTHEVKNSSGLNTCPLPCSHANS